MRPHYQPIKKLGISDKLDLHHFENFKSSISQQLRQNKCVRLWD